MNKVHEDLDEMIWIATEDGLCRFDGSRITTYRNDPDNPNSIQSNFIRTICTDKKGHTLIATTVGLQLYRPSTDDFSPLITNPEQGIKAGNVNDLQVLDNGDIFVCGNYTYTVRFNTEGLPQAIPNSFTDETKVCFRAQQDKNGDLWVIRYNDGIYRLEQKTGEIHVIQDVNFTCIGMDQDGIIYAGGQNTGIFKYQQTTDSFIQITPEEKPFTACEFCQIPSSQQMYVATDGRGILNLDCRTGDINPFIFDDLRIDSRSEKVHSLCFSRNGELWMALYQKGVLVQVQDPLAFHYLGASSSQYNCIGDHCVTSFLRTHDKNLWVSTDNGGIYCINKQGRTLRHLPVSPLPSALVTLFEDSRNRVWYGSYGQGGGIVDFSTGKCQEIDIEGHDGSLANIYAYAEDKRGQIWIASMGLGVFYFDEQQKVFRPYHTFESAKWCSSMEYNPTSDKLFIGTYDGLITISFGDQNEADLAFDHYVINSVTQCNDSTLSLCTNSGIILYRPETGNYDQYSAENGMPKGALYTSEIDNEGNLWISGSAGLSKLNLSQGTVTNYNKHDGLKASEFYKNASMRDDDGTLWFGGTDGITWFHPEEILPHSQTFETRIVGLRADQALYMPDLKGDYHLGCDDHSFTIELATRPILFTYRVTYRYAIDNDPWQTLLPMMNRVSFSHIASGHHTIRFQAMYGEQLSEVHYSSIYIDYPWYLSWWAKLIWATMIILLLGDLWQIRRDHVRRQQAKQDEAIKEAKLQFFMNIAHEFRTPMTLIVGPLQKLIATDQDASRQHSYQLIDRNANRILNLINQMMDLRKLDKAQMHLSCQKQALAPLLESQISLMSDMSEIRKIDTHLASHIDQDIELWIDHDNFEKIMLNLLSNAMKYTPEGGYIEVDYKTNKATSDYPEGSVSITVTDSGIGIPPQEREHIFERFYQIRHGSYKQSMGTGIGLNLVHALVKLHHGNITLRDNPSGQGSQFVVTLPLGNSLFTADELMKHQDAEQIASCNTMVTTASILNSTLRNETATQTDSKAPAQHQHILVVEDDEEIRNYLLQELLPNYRVTLCEDGQSAFDLMIKSESNDNTTFDLVLTDLMMPKMDGMQLCQKIRGNVRLNHIPVILLTAKTDEEERMRSLEFGANAFVTKPFNIQLLTQTIRNILENQSRLRNSFSGQQVPASQVNTPSLKSPDERLLERIIHVINENLSNPELSSEMIAREVGLSRVHLYRKLKELTNQSARNYIRNIRLTKAAELMSQKKLAVSEVAYKVGFSSSNNFTSAFKELFGMSPTEYMDNKTINKINTRS